MYFHTGLKVIIIVMLVGMASAIQKYQKILIKITHCGRICMYSTTIIRMLVLYTS